MLDRLFGEQSPVPLSERHHYEQRRGTPGGFDRRDGAPVQVPDEIAETLDALTPRHEHPHPVFAPARLYDADQTLDGWRYRVDWEVSGSAADLTAAPLAITVAAPILQGLGRLAGAQSARVVLRQTAITVNGALPAGSIAVTWVSSTGRRIRLLASSSGNAPALRDMVVVDPTMLLDPTQQTLGSLVVTLTPAGVLAGNYMLAGSVAYVLPGYDPAGGPWLR